jgi:hypothetical protein
MSADELGFALQVYRKALSNGSSTVVITVTTRAPNGTYANPVKIYCDYGAVPHLAGALQAASELAFDHLPLLGDE